MSWSISYARTGNTRTSSFVMTLMNPSLYHWKSSLQIEVLERMKNYQKDRCSNGNRMPRWDETLTSLESGNIFTSCSSGRHRHKLFFFLCCWSNSCSSEPKCSPIIHSRLCLTLQYDDSYQINTSVRFHVYTSATCMVTM